MPIFDYFGPTNDFKLLRVGRIESFFGEGQHGFNI